MIRRGIEFPYVHDLARLLSLLEAAGHIVPEAVMEAEELTQYAMSTRYPSLEQPVTKSDYDEAVRVAEAVVRWAEEVE